MKTNKTPSVAASAGANESSPVPTCPGCGMNKNEWPGEGYAHEGESYCCQGCAEGTGCTCRSVSEPGFSREGQVRTRPAGRPGEQRSGAPAPHVELTGERDDQGTEEGIDEPGCGVNTTKTK